MVAVEPGVWGALPNEFDVRALLRAEILRSLTDSSAEDTETRADELADLVWRILGSARATTADNGMRFREVGVDALLLARFLADRDRGEGD